MAAERGQAFRAVGRGGARGQRAGGYYSRQVGEAPRRRASRCCSPPNRPRRQAR
jgi:hypothetical protein